MLNTDPEPAQADDDAAVHAIMRSGSLGAIVLAGFATAIVVALWLAFYLLVFIPRAMAP
jgi:hypothetical protein